MNRSSKDMTNASIPINPLVVKARPNTSGFDYGEADYGRSVRSAFHAFWNGTLDRFGFVDEMVMGISRGYRNAWYTAIAECGLTPDDMTIEERNALEFEINNEYTYLLKVADFVEENSKANGGKFATVRNRSDLWSNRYRAVKSLARMMSCGDTKMEWVYGDTKHCSDCMMLNGKVYRASVWRANRLEPGSYDLECHGFNCRCQLLPTSKPSSRGRPPMLVGRRK